MPAARPPASTPGSRPVLISSSASEKKSFSWNPNLEMMEETVVGTVTADSTPRTRARFLATWLVVNNTLGS